MAELETSEHLIHFMKSNVDLSRFDEKFIESLSTQQRVTTNQVELFYKLIFKYRRQLVKHELDPDKLIYLPWKTPVIESSPQYTHGILSIENNEIIFKCPYNRNFISAFRMDEYNCFVWDKEKRQYSGKFGTHALKTILNLAVKHFKNIDLCPITVELIDQIKEYDNVKYWHPTLVIVNDRPLIAGLNSFIADQIQDIELTINSNTLTQLVEYGVTIDPSVYDITNPKDVFMSNYFVKHEGKDLLNIIPWLKEIECDMVYVSGNSMLFGEKIKQFTATLKESDIDVHVTAWGNMQLNAKLKHNRPVHLVLKTADYEASKHFSKVVHLVNSQPIEVK